MDKLTSSVSKGCFVIPGKSSSKLEAKKYLNGKGMKSLGRWEMTQNIWKNIELTIDDISLKLQENMFSDLVKYFDSSKFTGVQHEGRRNEIPTAAVITGVNMPDHAAIFTRLKNIAQKCLSQDNLAPFVVILQAKHCANIKFLMKSLGGELMKEGENQGLNLDENDFGRRPVTLSAIEKWYNKLLRSNKNCVSPRKKRKTATETSLHKPSIIIMCQDFESFPSKILHDFILMCSGYINRLPFLFVFGVATSWSIVSQRLLPHSAIVHLSVEIFQAPSASSHLAQIIDQILLTNEHPFKLDGRCLQIILDVFLCHDFSIKNFLHTLKFCVFEHFYNKPSSILCSKSPDMNNVISRFSAKEVAYFKTIPSIKSLISVMNKENQKTYLQEDIFKSELQKMYKELQEFHENYFPVLRSLFSFTSSLPQHPLGQQIRELYCSCFQTDLAKLSGYRQSITLLRVSSRDQLIERLTACLKPLFEESQLNSDQKLRFKKTVEKIKTTIKQLETLDESQEEIDEDEKQKEVEKDEVIEKVKYAYQLQERLRDRVNKKRVKKLTKYEILREDILNFLKEFFEYHLRSVKNMPMYEIFYYEAYSDIKQHLIASPRLAIQTALSNPYKYLQVPSLETVIHGVIPPNAPDICVAYKLHNESGSIINLYDWMSAFHTIVTATDNADDNEDGEISEINQARFIRVVSELQLLGFIKPTKKKTDHVQRLTWSHV